MKVLLLGKNGNVGWELQRLFSPHCDLVAPGRQELDLEDISALQKIMREMKPQLVLNAAAYTSVERAEEEVKTARTINAVMPGVLAEETRRLGGALVHYSTDYVFNGLKKSPYREIDNPCPLNHYGLTKLEGDQNIQQVGGSSLILRISWVYGNRGNNFVITIRRLAKKKKILKVVYDQVGSPTWSRSVAKATYQIIRQGSNNLGEFLKEKGGLYNYTSPGGTSWYRFARAVVEMDPDRDHHILQKMDPVSTKNYSAGAVRPKYSVLDVSRIIDTFNLTIEPWQKELAGCLGWQSL